MSPERLLKYFDQIADAPDAVPRLRRFILDLAVRGKLVGQNPEDEPASELLERIERARQRFLKEGHSGNQRVLSPIRNDETPFLLPETWKWVRLGDIFDYDAGTKTEPNKILDDAWLLELEDIEKDSGKILQRFTAGNRSPKSTKSEFKPGDVLYGKLRPYLNKAVVADSPGFSTTEIVALRCFGDSVPHYTELALRRPDFVAYVTRLGQGTKMPRLRTEDAVSGLFPLPPLPEQHRIVAKVDELMGLCDELEAAQQKRERRRDRLVAAAMNGLNNGDGGSQPGNRSEFEESARFYFKHLPRLTTRPVHIHQLRQTILNLAVRGKLVRQDPNDEPTDSLISRIEAERNHRASDGEPVDIQALADSGDGGFPIPQSWRWARLGFVTNILMGQSPPGETYNTNREGIPLINGPVEFSEGPFGTTVLNKYTTAPTKLCKKGDLLLCVRGSTTGRTNIAGFDACIGRGVAALQPFYTDQFVRLFVWLWRDKIIEMGRGIAFPSISRQQIEDLPIPIPPLAEQNRIVAKVDELMGLCDGLESRLTANATTRLQLLEATLSEAIAL